MVSVFTPILGILALSSRNSSSARAFSSRRGLGKQRHVQTRYLWIQDRVAKNDFSVVNVPTSENVSDILTKATSAVLLGKHMNTLGFREVTRSDLQKRV